MITLFEKPSLYTKLLVTLVVGLGAFSALPFLIEEIQIRRMEPLIGVVDTVHRNERKRAGFIYDSIEVRYSATISFRSADGSKVCNATFEVPEGTQPGSAIRVITLAPPCGHVVHVDRKPYFVFLYVGMAVLLFVTLTR